MINPNALPTSPTVQDFQNLESALDSSDYNDTLQAMQYMKRPKQGLISNWNNPKWDCTVNYNIDKEEEEQ